MAPPAERFPCTPLNSSGEIWLTDQSGAAQVIATISQDPALKLSQTFEQAVIIGTQSYYFTYEGEDAFCPYLIDIAEGMDSAQVRKQLARHLLVQGQSSALSVGGELPPGFLLSPGGAAFLFHASMGEAMYLGDVTAAATFFTAVGKLGISLYLHWSEFPEDVLTPPPPPPVADNGLDQLQGDEALGVFFDWLRNSPDGDPAIADRLKGMIHYEPALPAMAEHDRTTDLVGVGPRWIDHIVSMRPEQLLFAATILHHEIVHQDQHDHQLNGPTRLLFAMALEVATSLFLGNPFGPSLSADAVQAFGEARLPECFENEIPAFAAAYVYQQLRGGVTPAITEYVEAIYEHYLQGVRAIPLPSELYDYYQSYFQYNIAQFLPGENLPHSAQAILDIFSP